MGLLSLAFEHACYDDDLGSLISSNNVDLAEYVCKIMEDMLSKQADKIDGEWPKSMHDVLGSIMIYQTIIVALLLQKGDHLSAYRYSILWRVIHATACHLTINTGNLGELQTFLTKQCSILSNAAQTQKGTHNAIG